MRYKFVQIASFALAVFLLLSIAAVSVQGVSPGDVPDEGTVSEQPGTEQPGEGEDPGTEQPGEGEDPGTEQPGEGEDPGTEQPGEGEDPGTDQPGEGEDPGTEQPGEGEDPDPEETPYVPPEELYGIGAKIMRIGVYYGASGKQSIELKLVSGDGFLLGTYDSLNRFVQAPDTEPIALKSITVCADTENKFGFVVKNTSSGKVLYSYNDKGLSTGLAVMPYSDSGERTVTTCGYRYYGGFRFERFTSNNDLMTIVNYVSLDDYVKGVVPYEMSPSWPVEALKAQAVAARTYALTHISASHQNTYHFDLCDSTHCQAYKGVCGSAYIEKIDEVVDGTSGLTVQYNGKYCETVYCASNGGATENNVNVFGGYLPYLMGVTDPYEALVEDKISKYHWSVSYTGKQLQEKLAADYKDPGLIVSVKTTLSEMGNVIALTFTDENGKSFTKYNYRCRTFLSLRSQRYEVSSETGDTVLSEGPVDTNGDLLDLEQGVLVMDGSGEMYTVSDVYLITEEGTVQLTDADYASTSTSNGSVFTFSGTGWGHNLGMSQWGAYSMAQLGYNFMEILQFYYTGVTIA